jgi:hypothetical protein
LRMVKNVVGADIVLVSRSCEHRVRFGNLLRLRDPPPGYFCDAE